MSSIVYDNIPRVAPEVLDRFRGTSVSTLHEAYERRGLVDPGIAPIKGGQRMVGQAITGMCRPSDNLALHCAVRTVQPGDVVVLAMEGWQQYSLWGELIATAARGYGAVGAAVDGPVRDLGDLRDLDFPTWSRGASTAGSIKAKVGGVNVPISFGGIVVNPGDIVVGDDDGLIVIPLDEVDAVLARAEERDAFEVSARERMASGERLFDILGLQPVADQAGIDFRSGDFRAR